MLNEIAKFLAITGFILGIVVYFLLAVTIGESKAIKAGAFFVVGCYIILVDLAIRGLANAGKYWRFLSPTRGGTVLFAPAWTAGLAILAGGILILEDD